MIKFFRLLMILSAGIYLSACSPSHEEQAVDPANCEQMKDMPDAYERCLEELR